MYRWRSRSIHNISISLSSLGIFLLVAGILIGWFAPWAGESINVLHIFRTPLSILGDEIDINAFLGADMTALAVIIAVLIGYNASTLQIAGQLLSPVLVRTILLSLVPFLICWSFTAFVTLTYFLIPPTFVAQLLQILFWFLAIVLLMIGYLWNLPWRLSGEHAALWAIRELRHKPINQWESIDGYSVLQTAAATAAARADLGTVRSITTNIGSFLASTQDSSGEMANHFDRERYRSLKNLLSGCAQNVASAPNAVAYYLGFITAGVLLQAVAVGCANDTEHDLFSGLFRTLHNVPGYIDPLWTGMRHGLCRKGMHGDPYLIQFWCHHQSWGTGEPRSVRLIAEILVRFHLRCWRELASNREKQPITLSSNPGIAPAGHPASWSSDEVNNEATGMLTDLYRDIARYLLPEVTITNLHVSNTALRELPQQLLDTLHTQVLQRWPISETENNRLAAITAYDNWHAVMKSQTSKEDSH